MVVNASHWISEIGSKLSPDCDFAMIWYWDHKTQDTKVSLRGFHDMVDVSEIAKQFGGGGHKKAAGFQLPKSRHVEDLFDKPKASKSRKKTQKVATKPKTPNRIIPPKIIITKVSHQLVFIYFTYYKLQIQKKFSIYYMENHLLE